MTDTCNLSAWIIRRRDSLSPSHADYICREVDALQAENERLRGAVVDVRDWRLPDSGVFYPDSDGAESNRKAPYDSFYANGTIGAKQYFQRLAASALTTPGTQDKEGE